MKISNLHAAASGKVLSHCHPRALTVPLAPAVQVSLARHRPEYRHWRNLPILCPQLCPPVESCGAVCGDARIIGALCGGRMVGECCALRHWCPKNGAWKMRWAAVSTDYDK